jgi:hypothetical protein
MIFKRGNFYQYKFKFQKRVFQGSLRTGDLDAAQAAYQRTKATIKASASLLEASEAVEQDWGAATPPTLVSVASRMAAGMRSRATKRKLPCTLSGEDVLALLLASNGRCSVSGVPLSLENRSLKRVSPWAPSIDRIDSRKGYTRNNCRITCYLANLAMSEYGEAALELMLYHYGQKRLSKGRAA